MENANMEETRQNIADLHPHILIIEHDPELRKIMKISLEQLGVKVTVAGRFTNALQSIQGGKLDLLVVDFGLADGDPGKLVAAFRQNMKDKKGAVIVTTADRLEDAWRRKHRPDSVIYKPFDIRYLNRSIGALIPKKDNKLA